MSNLEETYEAIERKTSAFSRETGIACPPGCGECCTAIDFAVSRPEADAVAEFLLDHPAALARFESLPIEDARVLERKVVCPLYDTENGAAHCSVYEARPLLCRTFAFSAHREKEGGVVYVPCHRFRDLEDLAPRVEHARVESRAGRGPALPILPDEAMAIWSSASGESLPMGPAVARALDMLRLRRGYAG